MYSEQGLEARIRPSAGEVCHSLMVVSNCTPGSAQAQAASAIWFHRCSAETVFITCPVVRSVRAQSWRFSTALMKSSVTRTELLEFCPEMVAYASPLKSAGKPPFSIRRRALSSSTFFQLMYSSTSGWSMSRITILAARRVVPPDLMAPAARSPILRNDITPEDVPPPDSFSPSARRSEKFEPAPEPNLKMRASRSHRSMIPPGLTRSSSTLRMKQAWGAGRE